MNDMPALYGVWLLELLLFKASSRKSVIMSRVIVFDCLECHKQMSGL